MSTALAGRNRWAAARLPVARHGTRLALAATVTALLTVWVAVSAVTGWDSGEPWFAAGVRVAGVLSVAGVGLWATARRPENRFGPVMVGVGLLYGITMLNGSDNSVVYSTGRTALVFAELALVYLILAFPSGRLVERRDQLLVRCLAAFTVLLWVPAVLLGPKFTVGGPTVACDTRCPANAFMVTDRADLARGLSNAVYLVFLGAMVLVVASLYRRYAAGAPVLRRTLSAVTVTTGARATVLIGYAALAVFAPHSVGASAFSWLIYATTIAIPLAFVVGTIRARLLWIDVLETLINDLNRALDPIAFRRALAGAVGDPSLKLVHVGDDGSLTNLAGDPVERPVPGSASVVTAIEAGPGHLALLHDVTLLQDPEFLDAVVAATAIELEQYRRRQQVDDLVGDLRASRSRLAAARDEERRRVERDLHDGAQQELVAVKLRLAVVDSMLESDPAAGGKLLAEAMDDLDAAIGQLRLLAHGIYPPLLESDGAAAALRPRPAAPRCPRGSTPTGCGARRATSRPRCTSAASRRCRTPTSTRAPGRPGRGAAVARRGVAALLGDRQRRRLRCGVDCSRRGSGQHA